MENYRLLERLGKGGQGSVYVVEHKQENKKYVLKKVECHDESDANKAFSEALALQKLNHPYICGYKEFFVTWEKEESSMFFCTIMEYCSRGDLRAIIREHQQSKIPIPEEELKRYIGEILNALVYAHHSGIIHRNLKPSNIFVKDSGSLCLGDFGVSTVMSDMRTCTRNTVGTTIYFAPEVMTQAFDEHSDVWSLGCILFEMTTTFMYDMAKVVEKLDQIKKDAYILEEIFEEISKHHSDHWIKTLRLMLKLKHQTRPTAEALVKMSFIQECVDACDSSLIEKRNRQNETTSRIRSLTEGRDDADYIIRYIADTIDHEHCVKEGLEALQDLFHKSPAEIEGPPVLDQASKNLITLAMWDNIDNPDIQVAGCSVLSALIVNASPDDVLFTPEVISVVDKAIKTHQGNTALQQVTADLILALSTNSQASVMIGQLGGIRDLLTNMKENPTNLSLLSTCCTAIWSLTIQEKNAEIAAEEKAIKEVLTALQNHVNSPEIVEAASAAMISLCLDDRCFEIVNTMDGVGSLFLAMDEHIKNPKIMKNICMVLATLVEPNEECAFRVLASDNLDDKNPTGLPILIKAYELHRDNAEVVEAIVTVIMELCEYDEICLDMNSYNMCKYLKEIRAKYNQNQKIMEPCERAIQKLGPFAPTDPLRRINVPVK